MTNSFLRLITASVIVLGLESSTAIAQPGPPGRDVPQVPPNIEVPAGYSVFLKGHAVGTQNYICLPATTGVSWRLFGPEATLFRTIKGEIRSQVMTHFLSANPDENGLARPTWQHSFDSSRVWGRALASSNDPSYVEPGAIPWLLLEVTGAQLGPTGGSRLTEASYIHRLNTSGGVAPSTGCSQPANIGATALVPYTADYFFYKASRER